MSKATKEQQTQDIGDDNLMNVLDKFNTSEGSETEGAPEVVLESQPETDVEVEADEPAKEQAVETSDDSKEKSWLIENKFRDDDDGKSKLAEAYRNMQSMKDKAEQELGNRNERYEKLSELDEWLKQNPEMVKMMQNEVQKQDVRGGSPPAKPEDYDVYEESVEGSLSAKWRGDYDEWLMEQGAKKAMQYVDRLRAEDQQINAQNSEIQALKSIGMSDEEIKQYYSFMSAPENVTPQNMVEVWKKLDPQAQNTQESDNAESEANVSTENVKKSMTKVPNAGAVDGKTAPVKSAQDKQVESWWTGIMANSR